MKTGHRPNDPRCPLASLIPEVPDKERIKREGWTEQGILVVALDDERLDQITREFVKLIGRKLYGRENNGNI